MPKTQLDFSFDSATAKNARARILRASRQPARRSRVSANWHSVWVRKGTEPSLRRLTLQNFFKLNGWDTGAGQMDRRKWLALVDYVQDHLNVRRGESLLEVGCGAGLFLLPFAQRAIRVSGVDYSPTLVRIARMVLPRGATVRHAEASGLPFPDGRFDHAASNGVFLYFPDWAYAEKALDEIVRVLKPGGTALITDLNDLTRKRVAEARRRQNLGVKKYREMYRGLGHMYYRKEWFERYARRRGLEGRIVAQTDANPYGNSAWRFMFYLAKPAAVPAAA